MLHRRRAPATLLILVGLLASFASAQAAPTADLTPSLQVPLDEMAFTLPGSGWTQVAATPTPGQALRQVGFKKSEGDHDINANIYVLPFSLAARTQPVDQLVTSHLQDQEPSFRTAFGDQVVSVDYPQTTINGTSYSLFTARIITPPGYYNDVTELVWVPADFVDRGRMYSIQWVDNYAQNEQPLPPDELNAWVASFNVRGVGTVIAEDSFNDPNNGLLPPSSSDPSTVTEGYENGDYLMHKVDLANDSVWREDVGTSEFADVAIDVDVRVDDNAANQQAWVFCDRFGPAPSPGYRFYMTEGGFGVIRSDPTGPTVLLPLTPSGAINPGNATNHIQLVCSSGTILASINGQQVASIQDPTYDQGAISLAASSDAGAPFDVHFSNLVITQN